MGLYRGGLGDVLPHVGVLALERRTQQALLLEELAALKDRYLGRLQIYHFLTSEFDDIELFNGRLDEARIAMVLDSLVDPAAIDVASGKPNASSGSCATKHPFLWLGLASSASCRTRTSLRR